MHIRTRKPDGAITISLDRKHRYQATLKQKRIAEAGGMGKSRYSDGE